MTSDAQVPEDPSVPSDCYILLGKSRTSTDFWASPRDLAAIVLLVFPLLILAATWIDGTCSLDGDAKGFRQHHGFWIIFVTTPALVLLAGALLDRFVKILREPHAYLSAAASETQLEELRAIAKREIDGLCLRTNGRFILYFGIIVGLIYFFINVVKTWDPSETYGHDVFDAWAHTTGYFTTKIYLLPVFVLVYPISIFIAAHVTMSMVRLLRYLCNNDVLEISYFHEDNCGGTSCFGEVNLLVMGIYALLIAVLVGMWFTHERIYFVTRSGLVFCSLATTLQSVVAVWAIHQFVSSKKKACLAELTEKLNGDLQTSLTVNSNNKFRSELLAARNHIAGIYTFPYAKRVALAVNTIRFAPVAIAIFSFATK